jgi:hypothetical protein
MQDEKDYDQMTRAEKVAVISNVLSGPQVQALLPLPAAANRAALTPEQQETAFENWIAHIDSRSPQTWTPEEKAAYRVAIQRAAKTL